jgi:hypothetical protein
MSEKSIPQKNLQSFQSMVLYVHKEVFSPTALGSLDNFFLRGGVDFSLICREYYLKESMKVVELT